MRMLSIAAAAALLLFISPFTASAQDDSALPQGFNVTPLLKTSKTADGEALKYPSEGSPEVVSVIGTLEPKGKTALHQHPVPVFVYVMEGQINVQTEGGERRQYKQGDAFVESVGHWHQAFNDGDQPAKILVVFMGMEGKPTTEAKQ